jgi:hypothetical protein
MPVGDSLTAGGAGDPSFLDSYRYELWNLLNQRGINFTFVGDQRSGEGGTEPPAGSGLPKGSFAHSGHGGWGIGPNEFVDAQGKPTHISAFIDTWTSEFKPDVVLLNLGSNAEPDGAKKLSVLIARIRKSLPNAVIVTSSMTPFEGEIRKSFTTPERIALSKAARNAGEASPTDRTIFSDVRSRLLRGTDGVSEPMSVADFADDVHLRPSGGAKWAHAWLPETLEAIRLLRPLPCYPKLNPKATLTGAKRTNGQAIGPVNGEGGNNQGSQSKPTPASPGSVTTTSSGPGDTDRTVNDPAFESEPTAPARLTTTIALEPDAPLVTRSDGSPVAVPLRTIPPTTTTTTIVQPTEPAKVVITVAPKPAPQPEVDKTKDPNRFASIRSFFGLLGLVGLLTALASVITHRTPRNLRGLLLGAAILTVGTVGLISLLGITDELLADPRQIVRFAAKTVGALAFLGAGALRYLIGDRTLSSREIASHARTRESAEASAIGRVDQVMGRFTRLAAGQVLFGLVLVGGAVLLMSR